MAFSGCAIVLMSGAESANVLAGAGRHARTVTGLQMELGKGSCLQAHASGIPVLLPDLVAENASRWLAFAAAAPAAGVHAEFSLPSIVGPGGIGTLDLCRDRPNMLSDEHIADSRARWPVFVARASDVGFRVMCAVPPRVRAHVIGALNVFRGSDEPFTGTEMEIAQAMPEMAAIGLTQERALRERNLLAEQLHAALNSRVVIEQAKGMLAEYLTITVDDAFTLLRNYAGDHNRKLSAVASDVVDRKIPSAALARRPRQQL
jgi:ANTAR domain